MAELRAEIFERFRLESTRRTIDLWDAWPEEGTLLPFLRSLEVDLLTLGNNVSTVCNSDTALQGAGHLDQISDKGAQIRVACAQLPDFIILDRRVAVLRPHDSRFSEKVLVVHDQSIVSALCNTFFAVWQSAVKIEVFRQCGLDVEDEVTAQILELLSSGCKDETAARRLQMSVRTYRRHVARVMERLGAESRFQAGALASRLGLLQSSSGRQAPLREMCLS
jgi:DNA-binding CsgD family transcriptional regulator